MNMRRAYFVDITHFIFVLFGILTDCCSSRMILSRNGDFSDFSLSISFLYVLRFSLPENWYSSPLVCLMVTCLCHYRLHTDTVHGAGCNTEFTTRAFPSKNSMHLFGGTHYGIYRTGLNALNTTDAERFIYQRKVCFFSQVMTRPMVRTGWFDLATQ